MEQNTNNNPKDNNQDLRWVHGIKANAIDVQNDVHNASVFLKKIKARGLWDNVTDVDINANPVYAINDLFLKIWSRKIWSSIVCLR
jgi:hypothetical protein